MKYVPYLEIQVVKCILRQKILRQKLFAKDSAQYGLHLNSQWQGFGNSPSLYLFQRIECIRTVRANDVKIATSYL